MSTNSVSVTISYKYKYCNDIIRNCPFFGLSGDVATCALFPLKGVTHKPRKLKRSQGMTFIRCAKCVIIGGM